MGKTNEDYTLKNIVDDCFKEENEISFHLDKIKQIQSSLKAKKGNLTCRVMLRALNVQYKNEMAIISIKELFNWFETGQHLKDWTEFDTM